MKKTKLDVYEVTPKETLRLPVGTQVLGYDAELKVCSLNTITEEDKRAEYVLKESICKKLDIHFFIFDLPEGFKAV